MVGLLVTLASCAASNKYVKLTLSEDYYEVYKGQTLEILPIVNKGSAVGDVTIEYSSYDETIATYVDGNLQGVEYEIMYLYYVKRCKLEYIAQKVHYSTSNVKQLKANIIKRYSK